MALALNIPSGEGGAELKSPRKTSTAKGPRGGEEGPSSVRPRRQEMWKRG